MVFVHRCTRLALLCCILILAAAGAQSADVNWAGDVSGPGALPFSAAVQRLFVTLDSLAITVAAADRTNPAKTESASPPSSEETHGDWHSATQLTTRITTATGAGHVNGEVEVVATQVYTSVATGTKLGDVASSALGTFDVSACPDPYGIATGKISIAVRVESHAGNGTLRNATATRDGPFRFIADDQARLVRIESDYRLQVGALDAPPGDTDAEAWGMTGVIAERQTRGGQVTVTPAPASEWALSGPVDTGTAIKLDPAQTLLWKTLNALAAQAEEFWRSGKCIELTPSTDSRAVAPDEQIQLTVTSKQKFDGQPVTAPIKAVLTGVKSLMPNDAAVAPPAQFDFVAGHEQGDLGSIALEQTGKRGIGKRAVEFRVQPAAIDLTIEHRLSDRRDSPSSLTGMAIFDGAVRFDASLALLPQPQPNPAAPAVFQALLEIDRDMTVGHVTPGCSGSARQREKWDLHTFVLPGATTMRLVARMSVAEPREGSWVCRGQRSSLNVGMHSLVKPFTMAIATGTRFELAVPRTDQRNETLVVTVRRGLP